MRVQVAPHSHKMLGIVNFLFSIFFNRSIVDVALISAVQQSDSVIHIYAFFFYILFHYGLS